MTSLSATEGSTRSPSAPRPLFRGFRLLVSGLSGHESCCQLRECAHDCTLPCEPAGDRVPLRGAECVSHAGRGYPRYGPKARQGGLLPQQPAATATATRRTAHCKQPGHPEQQPQAPSRQCRESGPRHAGQDDATARPGGTCAHRSAECAKHLCAEGTSMSRLCHRSRQARYGRFLQALNSLKQARSARLQPNGAAETAPVLSKQLRRSEGVFGPE